MQNERPDTRRQKVAARDIAPRTFAFALRIIAVVRAMPKDLPAATIARQLIRSGTGIGANIEEAEAAHSKAEFVQKVNIARKESRETLYWLRLIADCHMVPAKRLVGLIEEAEQIVKILTAIVRSARKSR